MRMASAGRFPSSAGDLRFVVLRSLRLALLPRSTLVRCWKRAACSALAFSWLGLVSCASKPVAQHDQTLAVVWMQRSAEYRAACEQSFASAAAALPRAIQDNAWTACIEQTGDGAMRDKPVAVVVDVDETMLDNSAFAARQIEAGAGYDPVAWAEWCNERRATAIPGALAFAKKAASLGVRVVYVTNRRCDSGDAQQPSSEESDTRANLRSLGFPIDERDGFDVVLTKGEHGAGSDKTERRKFVAERFRIVQLIGDNLGDFTAGTDPQREDDAARYAAQCKEVEARRAAIVLERASWWGERWIMIPNPSYGGFETVVRGQHGTLRNGLRMDRR